MIETEASIKEELVIFYKQNGMIADNFRRNFIAHKTIDYLIAKGLLKQRAKKENSNDK